MSPRMLRGVLVILAGAVLALPSTALAEATGTVTVFGGVLTYNIDEEPFGQSLTAITGDHLSLTVHDQYRRISGAGCEPAAPEYPSIPITCPGPFTKIVVKGTSWSEDITIEAPVPSLLIGNGGPDVLNGGPADDVIWQDSPDGSVPHATIHGNSYVRGFGGQDELHGSDDWGDLLDGGPGDDWLRPRDGDDHVYGGAGADHIVAEDGFDGDDYYLGYEPYAGAELHDGVDTLDYSARTADLTVRVIGEGHAGQEGEFDTVERVEAFIGGSGDDDMRMPLQVPDNDDPMFYRDRLVGGPGTDTLLGGAEDDVLVGGPGTDTLDGQDGSDTASYDDRSADVQVTLDGVANDGEPGENDAFTSIENATGGSGNDVLRGSAAAETLAGGPGDDLFEALAAPDGDDHLDGGEGIDTASYAERADSLSLRLGSRAGGGSVGESDTFEGLEKLRGGSGADSLRAGGNHGLEGGPGDDVLRSRNGAADLVDCGSGEDRAVADFFDSGFDGCELLEQTNAIGQESPVIFVHGFLGAKINCGSQELWPNIGVFARPNLLDMRLDASGTANLGASECGAAAAPSGRVVDEVLGSDIYAGTEEFLEDNFAEYRMYAWDWRKGPAAALAGLDALIDRTIEETGEPQVVLYSHSMGGLVTRAYVDEPVRAAKVERVLSVGTPYLGSPKALFPLLAGIEAPTFSPFDLFLDNEDLIEFSRNLSGLYHLYPSPNYGPWLRASTQSPDLLTPHQVRDWVQVGLGGNGQLLAAANDAHTQTLDTFAVNGVDYQVLIGAGLQTIRTIGVFRKDGRDHVELTYANGDGTVPVMSARAQPPGHAGPLGEQVPIHAVCGIGHVELPGHPEVRRLVRDFLEHGAPISDGAPHCPAGGHEIVALPDSSQATPRSPAPSVTILHGGAELSITEAEQAGLVDVLEMNGQYVVVTRDDRHVTVRFAGAGAFSLRARSLADETAGAPLDYGTLSGDVQVAVGDSVTVTDDGVPVGPVPTATPTPTATPAPARACATLPKVKRLKLAKARERLRRARCAVKVKRVRSKVRRGRVIGAKRRGSTVTLKVSAGRRRS